MFFVTADNSHVYSGTRGLRGRDTDIFEVKQLSDLLNRRGVTTDAQGDVMRWPLRGPAVHPAGDVEVVIRSGGETEARVGVPDTKDVAGERPAFGDEPLEAAVPR